MVNRSTQASFATASERLFDETQLYAQVEAAVRVHDLPQTGRALSFAREKHAGQVRKGKEHIPYISHPLTMACHALAMGVADDDVLSAALLHDVCEDCGVLPTELPASTDVQQAVALLTKAQRPGESKQQMNDRYYAALQENRIAAVVKVLDRCSNVSTMALGFTREKIVQYIVETETYILPLVAHLEERWSEYRPAAFLLTYHMTSILKSLKQLV